MDGVMGTPEKMDAFSSHLVPFHMAAFARGRKHHPKSVDLLRALNSLEAARLARLQAEEDEAYAESAVKAAVDSMESTMREMGAL